MPQCENNHFCRCNGSCLPQPDPLAHLGVIAAQQGATPATMLKEQDCPSELDEPVHVHLNCPRPPTDTLHRALMGMVKAARDTLKAPPLPTT